MNIENRAAMILSKKLGIDVLKEEIGHETQWLHKEEIDERLVPAHLMEQLEETVIFNAAGYEAKDGTYYLLLQEYNVTQRVIVETALAEFFERNGFAEQLRYVTS